MAERFIPSIKEEKDISQSISKANELHKSQIQRTKILNERIGKGALGTVVTHEGGDDLWIRKETKKGVLQGVDAMKQGETVTILKADYKVDAKDGQPKLYYYCEVKNSSTVYGGKRGTDKGWIYAGYIRSDTLFPTQPTAPQTTQVEGKNPNTPETPTMADAEAKTMADAEAKTMADAEAKTMADAEAKTKTDAEAKAKTDAEMPSKKAEKDKPIPDFTEIFDILKTTPEKREKVIALLKTTNGNLAIGTGISWLPLKECKFNGINILTPGGLFPESEIKDLEVKNGELILYLSGGFYYTFSQPKK